MHGIAAIFRHLRWLVEYRLAQSPRFLSEVNPDRLRPYLRFTLVSSLSKIPNANRKIQILMRRNIDGLYLVEIETKQEKYIINAGDIDVKSDLSTLTLVQRVKSFST